jgi:hypothetical protein
MNRLFFVIFSVASVSLMGTGIVIVLIMGMVTAKAIIAASVAGLLLSIPVSWMVARAIV